MSWGRAAPLSAALQMNHRPFCPCQKECFSIQVLTMILPRHQQLCLCYSRQNSPSQSPPPQPGGFAVTGPQCSPKHASLCLALLLKWCSTVANQEGHIEVIMVTQTFRIFVGARAGIKKCISMKEASLCSPRAPDHNRTVGHGEFHTAGLLRSAMGNVKCSCTHTHHYWPSQKDWPELLSGTV